MGNRVSKKTVAAALKMFMAEDLVKYIFREIERLDKAEEDSVIGMTIGEWNDRFDESCQIVWADDTKVGFGNKGDQVCGSIDDCVICCTVRSQGKLTLQVWCEGLTSYMPFINAAMGAHQKQVEAKRGKGEKP